jgi:Fic family protein
MMWNWQQTDWPNFAWDETSLRRAEEEFLKGTGVFAGSLRHLPESDRIDLLVQAMSAETLTTSEIEGEILDRASVQSSIRRQLGLATDRSRSGPAEEGLRR